MSGLGDRLPRAFFARPPQVVAPELLGARIVTTVDGTTVAVRLTEVEAYASDDPASHAFRGQTPRNAPMFGAPGHLYVYFSYGMHFCANLVSHAPEHAGGVLLRAGVVVDGLPAARARRPAVQRDDRLARGPACLAQCLLLTTADSGRDVCADGTDLAVYAAEAPVAVRAGPRVGVSLAPDRPLRFFVPGEPSVSAYKRSPRAEPPGATG